MSENMNEPWSICGQVGLLIDRNGKNVIWSREVQRRIAACVNACAGVETELLESFPAPFSNLREERDQLAATLRLIGTRLYDAGYSIGGPIEHGALDGEEAKALLVRADRFFREIDKIAHEALGEPPAVAPDLSKQCSLLLAALKRIRNMTNADDPESYRCDDREGCLETVFSTAEAAIAAVERLQGAT